MTDSLYPFFNEKPYPTGYTPSSLFEHYQGIPTLDMPPVEKETAAFSVLPDVFMIRAEIQEEGYSTYPHLSSIAGESISMGRLDLYTPEGQRLIQQKRILSLRLHFQGLCLMPYGNNSLIPWDFGLGLLPFKKGEILGIENFPTPPHEVSVTSPPAVFPFGGLVENPKRLLTTKPLYFFVEYSEGTSLPQIKLLFEEDLEGLRWLTDCPLVLPDGMSPAPSLEQLLTEGLYQVTLKDPQHTSYKSIGITPLNHKGKIIDIIMTRAL